MNSIVKAVTESINRDSDFWAFNLEGKILDSSSERGAFFNNRFARHTCDSVDAAIMKVNIEIREKTDLSLIALNR